MRNVTYAPRFLSYNFEFGKRKRETRTANVTHARGWERNGMERNETEPGSSSEL